MNVGLHLKILLIFFRDFTFFLYLDTIIVPILDDPIIIPNNLGNELFSFDKSLNVVGNSL